MSVNIDGSSLIASDFHGNELPHRFWLSSLHCKHASCLEKKKAISNNSFLKGLLPLRWFWRTMEHSVKQFVGKSVGKSQENLVIGNVTIDGLPGCCCLRMAPALGPKQSNSI